MSHLAGDLLSLGAAAAWVAYNLAIGPLVGSLGTLQVLGALLTFLVVWLSS